VLAQCVTILCDKTKADFFHTTLFTNQKKSALLFFLTPESHGNWSQKKSSNFRLQEKKQSRFFRDTLFADQKKSPLLFLDL
jgi:hypothetical protein